MIKSHNNIYTYIYQYIYVYIHMCIYIEAFPTYEYVFVFAIFAFPLSLSALLPSFAMGVLFLHHGLIHHVEGLRLVS